MDPARPQSGGFKQKSQEKGKNFLKEFLEWDPG